MAAAGASKGDDENYYVMYCCTHCDEMFGSKAALHQHNSVCKKRVDTSWIKEEPHDEDSSAPSQWGLDTPSPSASSHTANQASDSKSGTVTAGQAKLPVPACGIKTEPSPSLSPVSTSGAQQVVSSSDVRGAVPQMIVPQFLVPNQILSRGLIGQPQIHTGTVSNSAAPDFLCQSFQMLPMRPIVPSSQCDSIRPSGVLSSTTSYPIRKKPSPLPGTAVIRNICPKEPFKSTMDAFSSIAPPKNTKAVPPKRKKVGHTPKTISHPAKMVEVCVSKQQPTSTAVLSQTTACVNNATTNPVAVVQPQRKSAHAGKSSGMTVLPQQTFLHTVQPVQPQTPVLLPQNLQQIPGLIQNAPVFVQAPQTIQQIPQNLFQSPPSLLQNNQPVLQQNLGQQNMLWLQTAQPNILGSHIMPVMGQQQIPMQVPGIILDTKPTIMPLTAVSEIKSECTTETATSSLLTQTQTTAAKSKPVSSSLSLTMETSSPQAVTAAQKPPLLSPLPVAAPLPLPFQLIPTIIPNPNGAGFVLQQMAVGASAAQASTQQKPLAGSQNSPVSASSGVGGSTNVATQLQTASHIEQNPSSNILFLPPMMQQGHVLGGIRLQSPMPLSMVTTSAASGVNGQQTVAGLSAPVGNLPVIDSTCQRHTFSGACGHKVATPTDTKSEQPVKVKPASHSAKCSTKTSLSLLGKLNSAGMGCDVGSSSLSGQVVENFPPAHLSFKVGKKRAWQPVSANFDYMSESTVLFVSKLILSDQVKNQNQGPITLPDGRVFVPIAYTGPYTPKQPSQTRKPENSKVTETDQEDKHSSYEYSIETMKLPGPLVWIFLDRDRPKILLKVEADKNRVIVMPLEQDLPHEALRQVTEMLEKAEVACPAGHVPFPMPKDMPPIPTRSDSEKMKALRAYLWNKMNHKPILPKGELLEKEITSHPHRSLPPDSVIPEFVPRTVMPVLTRELPVLIPTQLQCASSVSHSGTIQSETSGLSHNSNALKGQLGASSLSQGAPVSADSMAEGIKAAADSSHCRQKVANPSWQPQLNVRADKAVIQRALNAVVKVEKISLTDTLQQQLKVLARERDIGQSQSPFRKRGRKSHWLAEVLVKKRAVDVKNKSKGSGFTTKNSDGDHGMRSKGGIQAEKQKRKRKWKTEGVDEDDDLACSTSVEYGDRSRASDSKWSVKGLKIEPEENVDSLNCSTSETGRRRSVRILCKPKTNYWTQVNQDDNMEEGLDSNDDSSPEEHETRDPEEVVSREPSFSHLGKKGLGKHLGFDIYIDTDESTWEETGECTVTEINGDYDHDEDTRHTDKDTAVPESEEQHFRKHDRDFEVVQGGMDGLLEYRCTICGSFQAFSKEVLVLHLMQHYRGELTCKTCGFSAALHQELSEHEALEHTGKPLYHCPVCQMSFFNQSIFQSHVMRHGTKVCPVCWKESFSSETAREKHLMGVHFLEVICIHCKQPFINSKVLSSHYCKDGYPCCQCPSKLPSLEDLRCHLEEEHGHKDTRIRVCRVDGCHASFLREEDLAKHMSLHDRLLQSVERLSKGVAVR